MRAFRSVMVGVLTILLVTLGVLGAAAVAGDVANALLVIVVSGVFIYVAKLVGELVLEIFPDSTKRG